jgi:AcrR family transcriptional regulator
MGERRERERHEMRASIIDAARRLFVTEGYDRTTLRRIAEEIEYTPGAIYAYFKDKDAILYALHQEGFLELGKRMAAAVVGAANPREALERIGRAYLEFARENPEMYDLMFIAQATSRAMCEHEWPEGQRAYDMLKGVVQTALDGGWIVGGEAGPMAFLLWSTAHGMASLAIRERCLVIAPEDRLQVQDDAYQILVGRIATDKARPRAETEPETPKRRRGAPEL